MTRVATEELSFSEVGVIQCVWRPKHRPKVPQVLFNLPCLALSTSLAYLVCGRGEAMAPGSLGGLLS